MSTCNRLDLQTLGSQPVNMPKNLPDHWPVLSCGDGTSKSMHLQRIKHILDWSVLAGSTLHHFSGASDDIPGRALTKIY